MGYFNLRCFDAKVGKYIIIGLNVLVAVLGVTHWGCKNMIKLDAGMYGKIKSTSKTALGNASLDNSMDTLFDSPMAFFAISGVVQVLVSALVILLVL
jgi:hypothetical protein